MKICKDCGFPLVNAYCVAYKEILCFNCGRCYEFFDDFGNSDETPELLEKEKEMKIIKQKIYDLGFEKEGDGRTSKTIPVLEFQKRLKEQTNKKRRRKNHEN